MLHQTEASIQQDRCPIKLALTRIGNCSWLIDAVFVQREMTMNYRVIVGSMILMGLVSTTTLAQSTLGELLDAGGKKLSKDEVRTALIGAHVTGKTMSGSTVETDYKADGTYTGTIVTSRGVSTGVVGTWIVDDSGKLCVEYTLTKWNRRDSGCTYYTMISDRYYLSESDSDKNSPLVERTLRK